MAEYDFIVGSGSASSAQSHRLAESGRHSVLLLEAGPRGHVRSHIPTSYSKLIDNPQANWCYESEPEEATAGKVVPVPRGRLLGGSSAINGLVYVRGQPLDYDGWAQLGNRGWSWADVLPIFRALENYEPGADELRGEGGPLHVGHAVDQSPLYDALFQAGQEAGLPLNPDYNGARQEGITRTQATIRNGHRQSAAWCYLRPARRWPNLDVECEAWAQELLFEGPRCTGVAWRQHGARREARARGEVISCGGAVNSPQLLELSGIGRPKVLGPLGIPVRHALAGVGENLRDHLAPRMQWRITQKGIAWNDRVAGLGLAWQALRYLATRRGFLNLPSAPVLAFVKTRPELETPDVQIHFITFAIADIKKRELGPTPGITTSCYVMRPESTGSIHLRSADPHAQPAIRFNFLATARDRETMLAGLRWVRRIVEAEAMDPYRGAELAPGPELQTDDELLVWTRENAATAYHPSGTCKMGTDDRAVVDAGSACTGWKACASPTPRSCRPWSPATPTGPAS